MSKYPILAIDIGAKFTKAFVKKGEKDPLVHIKTTTGKDLIPTIISWSKDVIVIANEAQKRLSYSPSSVISNFLFFLTRDYDKSLQDFSTAKIKRDEENDDYVVFVLDDGKIKLKPVECLMFFIDGIIDLANIEKPNTISLSVPPWWTAAHKQILYDACELLEIENIIITPSNVCSSFVLSEKGITADAVIADIGEQRFNLSHIKFDNGKARLIKYEDYEMNSNRLTSIIGEMVYKKLKNLDSTEKYNNFLDSLKRNDQKRSLFIQEMEDLKGKVIPNGSVPFSGNTLTTDFNINVEINGKELLNPDGDICFNDTICEIAKRIVEFSNKLEGKPENKVFEIQGGLGGSNFLLNEINNQGNSTTITQIIHPLEGNAIGAAEFAEIDEIERKKFYDRFYEKKEDKFQCLTWDLIMKKKGKNKDYTIDIFFDENSSPYFSFAASKSFSLFFKRKPKNDSEEDSKVDFAIPFFPKISNEYPIVKVRFTETKKTEIYGSINLTTGLITINEDENIEISYINKLDEGKYSEIKRKLEKNKKYQNMAKNMANIMNDFQEFYFAIPKKLERKAYKNFNDDEKDKIDQIKKSAENFYKKNSANGEVERFYKKLEEYKGKIERVVIEHIENEYEKIESLNDDESYLNLEECINLINEEIQKKDESCLKLEEKIYNKQISILKKKKNERDEERREKRKQKQKKLDEAIKYLKAHTDSQRNPIQRSQSQKTHTHVVKTETRYSNDDSSIFSSSAKRNRLNDKSEKESKERGEYLGEESIIPNDDSFLKVNTGSKRNKLNDKPEKDSKERGENLGEESIIPNDDSFLKVNTGSKRNKLNDKPEKESKERGEYLGEESIIPNDDSTEEYSEEFFNKRESLKKKHYNYK